jgi:hypothetical protein
MAENISVTRIIDLPEGPYTGGLGIGQPGGGIVQQSGGFANTYMPMDIHPNPYGMPPPPPGGILPPQHTQGRTGHDPKDTAAYIPEVQQRLPQRDIPMNIAQHTQDDQIQPNYIPPPPKMTSDYIQEYQASQDRQIREYEEKKMREKTREHWLEAFQWPVLVGLLYFVFQLPIVNTIVFKQFSFLSIYQEDGNFNLVGLTLKSILFATLYMSIDKSIEWVSGF